MPFTTDGSSHRGGISNEKGIVAFLNANTDSPISAMFGSSSPRFEHRGGTQTKTDAVCINGTDPERTISIKNHKQGTFDWLNSTSALPTYIHNAIKTDLQAMKTEHAAGTASLAAIRPRIANTLNVHLHSFTGEFIRAILQNIYSQYSDSIMIHDVKHGDLVGFLKEGNLPELATFPDCAYFLKPTPRAKTSAQIWRKNVESQEETNTHLRIRLVLNNGATALLGLSSSNSCSVPCIKIQQDDVAGFIRAIANPVHQPYTPVSNTETNAETGSADEEQLIASPEIRA